jgi:hypothetical protein
MALPGRVDELPERLWVAHLPVAEKDRLLRRVVQGEAARVRMARKITPAHYSRNRV